nr:nucleoside monophosphate kinase [Angustibacter aerolatus]
MSTGDIFRQNIAEQTPLGVEVQHILDAGGYVSDDITNAMVRDRIAHADCEPGFLLDGYPRTRAQVTELDSMLEGLGCALDAVVHSRSTRTRSCSGCCCARRPAAAPTTPRTPSASGRRSTPRRRRRWSTSTATAACWCAWTGWARCRT